jgi:hypothetical protein
MIRSILLNAASSLTIGAGDNVRKQVHKVSARFSAEGIEPNVMLTESYTYKGKEHVVRTGPYPTYDEAMRIAAQRKEELERTIKPARTVYRS